MGFSATRVGADLGTGLIYLIYDTRWSMTAETLFESIRLSRGIWLSLTSSPRILNSIPLLND